MKKILILLATFLLVCGANAQTAEEIKEKLDNSYKNKDWTALKEVQEFIKKKMPDSELAVSALGYEAILLYEEHKYEEAEKTFMSAFLLAKDKGIENNQIALVNAAFCAFKKAKADGFNKPDTDHAIQLYKQLEKEIPTEPKQWGEALFILYTANGEPDLAANYEKYDTRPKALRLSDEEYEATYEEMKKSDDFTITASGGIASFTKTLPNLCKMVWKGHHVDNGYNFTITSLDGDVFEGNVFIGDYDLKKIYTNKTEYGSIARGTHIEDIRFLGARYIHDGILTFANPQKNQIKYDGGLRIIAVPLTHPGDYYEQLQEFDDNSHTWKTREIDKINGYRITLEEGVLTYSKNDPNHFTLVYNNGDIFRGGLQATRKFEYNDGREGFVEGSLMDQFDRSKLKNVTKLADMGRLRYGDLKKKSGKLIVISEGEEDEFETLKREKEAKAKIEQEKETKAQIAQLNQRYGKKYVDMLIKGQIGVGMPEDLFNLGVNTNSFNSFDTCAVSIDYGHGDRCLDLYKFQSSLDFKPVGHIWIRNGVVSSISWY